MSNSMSSPAAARAVTAAPFRLILCDIDIDVIAAWRAEFADCADVEVRWGDLTDMDADAYVSPANSYGDMSGGIDLTLREHFGYRIEMRVVRAIMDAGGKLAVGCALVVETEDDAVPYLIVAPTMEKPGYVADTENARVAMRAMLTAARDFLRATPNAIEIIACPGFCTGTGSMAPEIAARQMRAAYEEFLA